MRALAAYVVATLTLAAHTAMLAHVTFARIPYDRGLHLAIIRYPQPISAAVARATDAPNLADSVIASCAPEANHLVASHTTAASTSRSSALRRRYLRPSLAPPTR